MAYRAILFGGLTAGFLDISAAFVNGAVRGRNPIRILQSIASGLLGADSYQGGFATAALGLALHFFIATVATAVYCVASRRFKLLVQQAIVCGLLYGVTVYLFMNFVVIPLSAIQSKLSYPLGALLTGLMIHMLCVGLPIALTVRRYSK
jgi:uncharacterized membrane protein YagU involved in acid resistance